MKDQVAKCEGQARGLGVMDRRGGETQVEGLAVDQGNNEEQARVLSMKQ